MKTNGLYISKPCGLWRARVFHNGDCVALLLTAYKSKRSCLNNAIKHLRVDGIKIFIENNGKLEEYGK